MAKMETYGFSWMDFVTAIPSPLFVVTSYKSNGKPNACLQSWACFSGGSKGFYAILSSVNKAGHLYQTVKEKGEVVLNFPSADIYPLCQQTIANNGYDDDEIVLSGLSAEPASTVNAPRIKERFLSLESSYLWEREITEGSSHVLMVAEKYRHCGIGSALLNYLFAECKTQKLFTSTNKSNEQMRKLLGKAGFTYCGEIDALDEGDPEMFFFRKVAK